MVVLKTFDNYFSANILLTRLQDAGVECYLFDENTVTLGPILSTAIGKIKLVTHKKDEARAKELLYNFHLEYMQSALCPRCSASDFVMVRKKEPSNMIGVIINWLSGSAAMPHQVYQCRQCGFESEELPQTTIADN